jgi:hypothetical protein
LAGTPPADPVQPGGSQDIDSAIAAIEEAERQLDFFTQQLRELAELDPSFLKVDPITNPESLSSMGQGKGLWQAPPIPEELFPRGLNLGADVPPELADLLKDAEGGDAGEVINPEDRYFEEISKEELREILYGTPKGRPDAKNRVEELPAEFEGWREPPIGDVSSAAPSSREGALRSNENFANEEAQNANAGTSETPQPTPPRTGVQKTQETQKPGAPPANGVSWAPLPPSPVLQSQIPTPPSPHPNLLPVSPLQRPSSWLSESYPSAPRLPFTSGRPPLKAPTEIAPLPTPAAPQPPIAPVDPLTNLQINPAESASSQGASQEGYLRAGLPPNPVPWPPLPPSPGSENRFRPPLNFSTSPAESVSSPGSPEETFDFPTPFSEGPSPSFSDSSSDSDRLLNPDVRRGPVRETPQLQSEALRRIFAMSPEELRALDRQLATGGAQLDLQALGLSSGGQQAPPRTPPAEVNSNPSVSAAAGVQAKVADGMGKSKAGGVADVGKETPGKGKEGPDANKAKTLDSIIEDLSSVTGDGSFAGVDPPGPGGGSVEELLDRLKRLVDISEKAIGELAFGGMPPQEEEEDSKQHPCLFCLYSNLFW